MTRVLNEKWLTKVDFSKGVIELTEWEEKIYQQGRADVIDEFSKAVKRIYFESEIDEMLINKILEQLKSQN